MAVNTSGLTGDIKIDAIRYLESWAGNITYSFTSSISDYPVPNYTPSIVGSGHEFAPLTQQQRDFVNSVFSNFNEFAVVDAAESGGSPLFSTIRLGNLGYVDAYPASGVAVSPGRGAESGNVFFRIAALTQPENEFSGNYLHEIGHVLGLKHPTETFNAGGIILPTVGADSDFVGRTVMGFGIFDAVTFLPNDILALQYNYGIDTETRKTSTTYSFTRVGDTFVVKNGSLDVMRFTDRQGGAIWDAGGTDTLDFSQIAYGIRANLNPGEGIALGENHLLNSFGSARTGYHIYLTYEPGAFTGSLLENVTGGGGDDNLTGNRSMNILIGGAGNDYLDGGANHDRLEGGIGADTLKGGLGADTMIGGSGSDTYVVESLNDGVTEYNEAGNDTIYASVDYKLGAFQDNLLLFENTAVYATGNAGDNYIIGNSAGNIMNGLGGTDRLTGGGGSDIFQMVGNWGIQVITDFVAGPGTQDAVTFSSAYIKNFSDVLSHSQQIGGDTYIGDGQGDLVVLVGVSRSSLSADDFGFF